jgi:transketolase
MKNVENLACNIRVSVLKMVNKGGSSHIGSILSIVDILAFLYGSAMKLNPKNPSWDKRDRFILSKGHAGAGVYAALAECGFFDTKELEKHCQNGSKFSGHVSHKGIPGIEFSTGSLGHGLPVSAGMAYAAKLNKGKHRVFCLMGDGEVVEGSNWEAMLFSAHHKLNNLIIMIDRNRLQSMKDTEDTIKLEPLLDKFEAFGWDSMEIDGHSFIELESAINSPQHKDKPRIIICNTVKGKGVSYMEGKVEWHYRTPTGDLFERALMEVKGKCNEK